MKMLGTHRLWISSKLTAKRRNIFCIFRSLEQFFSFLYSLFSRVLSFFSFPCWGVSTSVDPISAISAWMMSANGLRGSKILEIQNLRQLSGHSFSPLKRWIEIFRLHLMLYKKAVHVYQFQFIPIFQSSSFAVMEPDKNPIQHKL